MHLAEPRDGLPPLLDTAEAIADGARRLAAGHGPIAVDTERASAFRFDERAFLVQLRRPGTGTLLIDPTGSASGSTASASAFTGSAFSGSAFSAAMDQLGRVMNSTEWILHAAHTDLPALTTLGWRPTRLHDTQIAGRLLGMGQPGLAAMLEEFLDVTIDKDKGREDWSARPLTKDLLTYAALDVELLHELLDIVLPLLQARDRLDWYVQDCAADLRKARRLTVPTWTNLKGIQSLRTPRSVAVARGLAEARIAFAQQRDRPLERTMSSKDIVALAKHPHSAKRALGTMRMAKDLVAPARQAISHAMALHESELPAPLPRSSQGYPDHRNWEDDYPHAFAALRVLEQQVEQLAEELEISRESLAVMRQIRPAAWAVSHVELDSCDADDPVGAMENELGSVLKANGARDWQSELILNRSVPLLVEALTS